MATEGSTRKGKSKKTLISDENVSDTFSGKTATAKRGLPSGSEWKSPFKLQSPIFGTKKIYLDNWWLIRIGEGIGVGGFTMRKYSCDVEGVKTVYCSDAIKERHDSTTLETSDGYTIFISGLLNRYVTEKNGFPPEVCNYFHLGFPINWNDYASLRARGSLAFSPSSFEAMSLLQKQDFLLSAHKDEDAISEYLTSDLLQNIKSALASSKDDTARNGETKSKDPHKKAKDKTKGSTRVRR